MLRVWVTRRCVAEAVLGTAEVYAWLCRDAMRPYTDASWPWWQAHGVSSVDSHTAAAPYCVPHVFQGRLCAVVCCQPRDCLSCQ